MFKNIALTSLTVAGVATTAVLGFANMASAAIFNFSFSNVEGPVSGTVQGTIELPDGDGSNLLATSVIVTSAPASLGYTLPFDVFANFDVVENSFTVIGGAIDAAASNFTAFVAPPLGILGSALALNGTLFGPGSAFNVQLSPDPFTGVIDSANSTLAYTSATTTPEPGTILGLLAVGSIGALTRKRKAQSPIG